MKKTLLLVCLLIGGLAQAQEKKAPEDKQPTLEERFILMSQQRDALLKEVNKLRAEKEANEALVTVQSTANSTGNKYGCQGWNPDFTCTKPKVEPKAEEKKK